MDGKRVVIGMLGLAAVVATGFWATGLSVWWSIQEREAKLGVPKLTREEAAARVAKEDMFGLPSRLEKPPERDLTRAMRMGTVADPFSADEAGLVELFDVYRVTVKGCRGLLPSTLRDADVIPVYVTLRTVDGVGRVAAIDGLGEGVALQPYAHCVTGGVAGAVFQPPEGGERTLGHRLEMP